MKDRKLTLQVIVDQDSADWHWIYETLKGGSSPNGVKVLGIRSEWVSDETNDLLMRASNLLVELEETDRL